MPIANKKKIRLRMNELNSKTTKELREIFAGEMTELTYEAICRLFKARGVDIPSEHGNVTEDESLTHIITLDELKTVKTEEVRENYGMGFIEGISLVAGVAVIFFLVHISIPLAIICGVPTSILVFILLKTTRKYWRSLLFKDKDTLLKD